MKKYIFDLDNTLIFTDVLNNKSYNYALNKVGYNPIYDCKRVTREIVFNHYPNMDSEKKAEVIKLKKEYFKKNIEITKLNQELVEVLKSQKRKNCILWTCADEERVFALLEHYKLSESFKCIFFTDKLDINNDINEICETFRCDKKDLIFYEDDLNIVEELRVFISAKV